MPKRVSSKISSYIKPNQSQIQNQDRSQPGEETVIADMAKGFLQAQANMGNTAQTNNSQEVVELLNKINKQLESLQNSLKGNYNTGGQFQQAGRQSGQNQQPKPTQQQQASQYTSGSQTDADVSQELRNLFSMLLSNSSQQNSGGSSYTQGSQPEDQSQDQEQNQNQNMSQSQDNNPNNKANKGNTIAVQTAAQVLAQAQYELSNELEASLKKLKQVINESEKIANKISNLLGEENSQQQ